MLVRSSTIMEEISSPEADFWPERKIFAIWFFSQRPDHLYLKLLRVHYRFCLKHNAFSLFYLYCFALRLGFIPLKNMYHNAFIIKTINKISGKQNKKLKWGPVGAYLMYSISQMISTSMCSSCFIYLFLKIVKNYAVLSENIR